MLIYIAVASASVVLLTILVAVVLATIIYCRSKCNRTIDLRPTIGAIAVRYIQCVITLYGKA